MTDRPRYKKNHGLLIPASFPTGSLASAMAYEARAGDIFVATYPKCGTTWMQNIVWLLVHRGVPLSPEKTLDDVFPHIELSGHEVIDNTPAPNLIKTHLPLAMTPWHDDAQYIHVARNPFDCAVSFYHHTRGFPQHYDFVDGTFADYFECFVSGQVDFGDFFEHLADWFERGDRPNVLFLTYEALKADTRAEVKRVAAFLGEPFTGYAEDEKVLNKVLEHSSFKRMHENQKRWASSRARGTPAFVRKGVVGDWTSLFSPGQAQRLLDRCEREFAGTKMQGLWPEILAQAREYAG